MKKISIWLIVFLQMLFGLVFAALVFFGVFGKLDLAAFRDDEILKYLIFLCGGVFAALSAVVLTGAFLYRSGVNGVAVDNNGYRVKISRRNIRKLLKKASVSVGNNKLKTFVIEADSAGYVLEIKINVLYRNAQEVCAEFKGVAARLCDEVYNLVFKDIIVTACKVLEKVDVQEVKQEVKAEIELNSVHRESAAQDEAREQETEAQYFGPAAEPEEAPAAEPVHEAGYYAPKPEEKPAAPEPVKEAPAAEPARKNEAVFIPAEDKNEPLIKMGVAVKAKTGAKAKTPPAPVKVRKTIDPKDPPPFKL